MQSKTHRMPCGQQVVYLNYISGTMKRSGSADALNQVPSALEAPATPQHDTLVQFAEDEDEARNLREWRRWQFNLIAYTIMTILGIGVLLPWNVAINACVQHGDTVLDLRQCRWFAGLISLTRFTELSSIFGYQAPMCGHRLPFYCS